MVGYVTNDCTPVKEVEHNGQWMSNEEYLRLIDNE